MRIILTIAGLGKEFGGPSRSVPALAAALGRLGADVELITSAPAGCEAPLLPPETLVRSHLVQPASRRTRWFAPWNAFAATVRARCAGRADTVIHDQGIWLPSNHAVAVAAGRLDTPRIVSPRGMLSSWALAANGFKKKAAWTLYQRGDLMRAAALHATSESEAADCRRTGYQGRIDIVANGTEFPPACGDAKTSPLAPERVRTILYLGRVHPVKGLATLIDAWGRVRPAGWRLLIAGQDADGYGAELQRGIAAHGLQGDVQILGAVHGTDKWALYRSADVFVLPSHSENFGMVVAEALACGVPVLTTRGTPWRALVEQRCGWWIDAGVAALADALRVAVATPGAELRAMGARGRAFVESKFTWDAAAREMLSLYESVLRQRRDGRKR
jgi:glycosyltransferase involved in cell wall biosynthesis